MLGVALEFKGYPDTTTPLNPTNLNNMQKLLVDLIYPVGTYYETSDSNFDPNTAWGGTWELDQSGTVLVSKSNISGSKFNDDINMVVGKEEHTLTIDEIPSHSHDIRQRESNPSPVSSFYNNVYDGGGIEYVLTSSAKTIINQDASDHLFNTNSGGGQPHNNVQPSKIVNRWHRTA